MKIEISSENAARIQRMAEMMEGTPDEIANLLLSEELRMVHDRGRLSEMYGTAYTYDTEEEARRVVGKLQTHDISMGNRPMELVYPTNGEGRIRPEYALAVEGATA